jgi:sulfide dehydrogenase cytochrome subunit
MKFGWTAPALLLLAAAVPAHAQGQQALYARTLAASCAACHGTDGRVVGGAGVPSLAGQPREVLANQLRLFRDGRRYSTIMGQLSKGFSDARIDELAGYFSSQKPQ